MTATLLALDSSAMNSFSQALRAVEETKVANHHQEGEFHEYQFEFKVEGRV